MNMDSHIHMDCIMRIVNCPYAGVLECTASKNLPTLLPSFLPSYMIILMIRRCCHCYGLKVLPQQCYTCLHLQLFIHSFIHAITSHHYCIGFKQKDTNEHLAEYLGLHFDQSMTVINKQRAILDVKDQEISKRDQEIFQLRMQRQRSYRVFTLY